MINIIMEIQMRHGYLVFNEEYIPKKVKIRSDEIRT